MLIGNNKSYYIIYTIIFEWPRQTIIKRTSHVKMLVHQHLFYLDTM
jgi:hypothetical protein